MKRNMLFGAAALACLLGGCRLAVPQGAAGQDTLIGGYATWESIPYFSEHFLSGDRSPAHLYADWSSADRPEGAQWRNIFPNVTGYALCQNTAEEDGDTVYLGSGADPYFSGLAYNSAHNGSETTESMTGTLYADISQIGGDITGFTFSPVYQTADGQIYLAEGQRVTDRKQQLGRHQQNRAGFYRQTFLFVCCPSGAGAADGCGLWGIGTGRLPRRCGAGRAEIFAGR